LIVVHPLFDRHLLVKELTAVCFDVSVSITGVDGDKASGLLSVTLHCESTRGRKPQLSDLQHVSGQLKTSVNLFKTKLT
jgi:hypothetical protein